MDVPQRWFWRCRRNDHILGDETRTHDSNPAPSSQRSGTRSPAPRFSPHRLLGPHSPPSSFSSEICPQASNSFVRIQNMNLDYAFFHLFKALQSLRPDKTRSAFPESRSEVEVTLPKINYSLLGSHTVQNSRCQQRALLWQQFQVMNSP